jgi:hypothetical protein
MNSASAPECIEDLGGGDERVELIPRNPAAAKVVMEHDPDADDQDEEQDFTVADQAAPDVQGDLEWLGQALRAVVAGRVRLIEGSGRYRLEINVAAGDARHSTTHDLRGLLPAPGWRRRATVTEFEPYT